MKEFSMTIAGRGVDAMCEIAEEHGIKVSFSRYYYDSDGDPYCQVFSNTVENARLLQRVYNKHVRKLESAQRIQFINQHLEK